MLISNNVVRLSFMLLLVKCYDRKRLSHSLISPSFKWFGRQMANQQKKERALLIYKRSEQGLVCLDCLENKIKYCVVYFDHLLGAACTQKLVETIFQPFFNLFCSFQTFSVISRLKSLKNI